MRDLNKEHYNVKGKLIPSKNFYNYLCKCQQKCHEKVSEEARRNLFVKFWELGSYDSQTGYIALTVKLSPIKRKRAQQGPGKTFSRKYLLEDTEVCRDMYVNTFQISTKRINTALCKVQKNKLKDERGQKGKKPKVSNETIQKIIDHINSFPTYVSHYTRNETEAKFVSHDLTENKMFQLYIEAENPKVGFTFFKRVFYQNFNLRRKPPIKDTCNKCDLFKNQIKNVTNEQTKLAVQASFDEHLKKAADARTQMKNDFSEATTKPHLETVSYDMQKVLGLPKLPTNLVYYKRQLSIFNEGIHCASSNIPYAFIWSEVIAGRGAQEVGSCLKKFIDLHLKKDTKELVLWSDSCGGQNRNIKLVLLLKKILHDHPTLLKIELKYLESGHSFLINDTDFGLIERALKQQVRIYTLNDFHSIIEGCKTRNKFVVQQMKCDDFFSIEDIAKKIINRKLSVDNEKVNWLKAKVIRFIKEKPFSIFFKYTHTEGNDFQEVDISKTTKGRKSISLPGFEN